MRINGEHFDTWFVVVGGVMLGAFPVMGLIVLCVAWLR